MRHARQQGDHDRLEQFALEEVAGRRGRLVEMLRQDVDEALYRREGFADRGFGAERHWADDGAAGQSLQCLAQRRLLDTQDELADAGLEARADRHVRSEEHAPARLEATLVARRAVHGLAGEPDVDPHQLRFRKFDIDIAVIGAVAEADVGIELAMPGFGREVAARIAQIEMAGIERAAQGRFHLSGIGRGYELVVSEPLLHGVPRLAATRLNRRCA